MALASRLVQELRERSQSIVNVDLKFQGDHDLSWVLYYQNLTDFRVPWSVINDVLQTETFKLLVFRLDMRGEEWVTAISFPQPLHLHDVVQVHWNLSFTISILKKKKTPQREDIVMISYEIVTKLSGLNRELPKKHREEKRGL